MNLDSFDSGTSDYLNLLGWDNRNYEQASGFNDSSVENSFNDSSVENSFNDNEIGFHTFQGDIPDNLLITESNHPTASLCGTNGIVIKQYSSGECLTRWSIKNELARGTQAVVFSAADPDTGEEVSIRIAKLRDTYNDDDSIANHETNLQFEKDAKIRCHLKICKDDGTIPQYATLKDVFKCGEYGVTITELFDGNIMDLLFLENTEYTIGEIVRQLNIIIPEMHEVCKTVHMDLNYRNILFKEVADGFVIFITDFETSIITDGQDSRMMSAYERSDMYSIEHLKEELIHVAAFLKAFSKGDTYTSKELWEDLDNYVRGDLISRNPEFEAFEN